MYVVFVLEAFGLPSGAMLCALMRTGLATNHVHGLLGWPTFPSYLGRWQKAKEN